MELGLGLGLKLRLRLRLRLGLGWERGRTRRNRRSAHTPIVELHKIIFLIFLRTSLDTHYGIHPLGSFDIVSPDTRLNWFLRKPKGWCNDLLGTNVVRVSSYVKRRYSRVCELRRIGGLPKAWGRGHLSTPLNRLKAGSYVLTISFAGLTIIQHIGWLKGNHFS